MRHKNKWLCKLMGHKWEYWKTSWCDNPPNQQGVNRRCFRCDRMECTEDGFIWNQRLW